MAHALVRPAAVIGSRFSSSSNLSGQPCLNPWPGAMPWHRTHFESQGRANGRCVGQLVQSCSAVLRNQAQQACLNCACRRVSSFALPNWTVILKVYICQKLSSFLYVVLFCIFGASRIMTGSLPAPALASDLHGNVTSQPNSSPENVLSRKPERSDATAVAPCSLADTSVSSCLELASTQEICQSHPILRRKAWRNCDLEEEYFSVGREVDSGILLVGFGQGRRRKTNSFVKRAADMVGPAVVRLDTERDFPSGDQDVVQTRDHLFRQWFGDSDQPLPRKFQRERGQGSGFVFNGTQGMVVTNAHVVKGADRVRVTFTDGRVYDGEVAGTDDVTDIALIKVALMKGEFLPTALLGDSCTVELGDWAIAVGNPFGLDNTVSLGIISNLHRTAAEVGIPDKRLDFLQTDCAINPGNSGGPLLNEFGEVIGINTAIRADAEGISFAIPINKARKIIDALGEGKPVQHPFLGIQMATLSVELARHYNADPNTGVPIPEAQGVLIVKVSAESPAAFAGLRSGDVIVRVDGLAISSSVHLQRLVESANVGQMLILAIWRGDKSMEVALETGDMAPYFARIGISGSPNGCLCKHGNNLDDAAARDRTSAI